MSEGGGTRAPFRHYFFVFVAPLCVVAGLADGTDDARSRSADALRS
jgi:hypothetical protein